MNDKTTPQNHDVSFTDIDLDRLDEEWVRQPGLYYRYATRLADAQRKHAEAKAALEVAEAELSLQVRKAPEAFLGDVKPTEASVNAAVLLQPKYQKAKTAMIEAKHAVDVLEAAVWALDHKKKGLESAVQLQLANYRSAPRATNGEQRQAVEQMKDDARRRKIDHARPERR